MCIVLCIVCVYTCTVLLPPGDNPIAVNKYIKINLTIIETRTKLWRIFSSSKACIHKVMGMLRCSWDQVPRLVHQRRIGSKIPFKIPSFKALWLLRIPTGLILKFYVLSTECIFVFVWISEQMSMIYLHSINQLRCWLLTARNELNVNK